MAYMHNLGRRSTNGFAADACILYDLRRCLDEGYLADGFRRITTPAEVIALMDQIDALAWRFRERTVPRERRLREIAFYAEHQSYETEECPVWED
jgi:hypothetical protein